MPHVTLIPERGIVADCEADGIRVNNQNIHFLGLRVEQPMASGFVLRA